MINIKHYLKSRVIWIYLITILVFTAAIFALNEFDFSKINLILIAFVICAGFILLSYSTKSKDVHRTALLYLLIFCVIVAFTSPIFIAPDEAEHFARSDLTSEGILIPEYTPNQGYYMNNYFWDMVYNMGSTVFNANFSHTDIWDGQGYFESVFSQNLFYAYIAQAIGIFLAKIADLSMIWTLWLGRAFNAILYSIIACFAIKKAPKYKYTLLFMACLPLAVFQASSMSADSLIFAMGILNVSYFIRMYESESIDKSDLSVFLISGLLMGLLKVPYVFMLLLIFLIPKDKFKSENINVLIKAAAIVIMAIAMTYSLKYASHELLNGGRINYIIQNNISTSGQFNYILNNPLNVILTFIKSISASFYTIFIQELSFYHQIYANGQYIFNIILFIMFFVFSLFSASEFDKKERIWFIFIFLLVYLSTFLTQFLSWTPVGLSSILGIQARYFIPILMLIPFILGKNCYKNLDDYKDIVIMLITLFLSGMLILTLINFY